MRRTHLLALVALAVVALGGWTWWGTQFSPEAWQRNERRVLTGAPRIDMVNDLLSEHALVGRTHSEAVALLGEPEDTDYFADFDMVYWLGPERGFISIDSEWLVLRLGEDGRVTERRVVSD